MDNSDRIPDRPDGIQWVFIQHKNPAEPLHVNVKESTSTDLAEKLAVAADRSVIFTLHKKPLEKLHASEMLYETTQDSESDTLTSHSEENVENRQNLLNTSNERSQRPSEVDESYFYEIALDNLQDELVKVKSQNRILKEHLEEYYANLESALDKSLKQFDKFSNAYIEAAANIMKTLQKYDEEKLCASAEMRKDKVEARVVTNRTQSQKPFCQLSVSTILLLGIFLLFTSLIPVECTNFTVCNCENAEFSGIISLANFSACSTPKAPSRKFMYSYDLYEEEIPVLSFKAYGCRQIVKRLTRTSFFFGGNDSVYSTFDKIVNVPECWNMHRNVKCNDIPMVKDSSV